MKKHLLLMVQLSLAVLSIWYLKCWYFKVYSVREPCCLHSLSWPTRFIPKTWLCTVALFSLPSLSHSSLAPFHGTILNQRCALYNQFTVDLTAWIRSFQYFSPSWVSCPIELYSQQIGISNPGFKPPSQFIFNGSNFEEQFSERVHLILVCKPVLQVLCLV